MMVLYRNGRETKKNSKETHETLINNNLLKMIEKQINHHARLNELRARVFSVKFSSHTQSMCIISIADELKFSFFSSSFSFILKKKQINMKCARYSHLARAIRFLIFVVYLFVCLMCTLYSQIFIGINFLSLQSFPWHYIYIMYIKLGIAHISLLFPFELFILF